MLSPSAAFTSRCSPRHAPGEHLPRPVAARQSQGGGHEGHLGHALPPLPARRQQRCGLCVKVLHHQLRRLPHALAGARHWGRHLRGAVGEEGICGEGRAEGKV